MLPDRLECHRPTSTPCSPIVVNRYWRSIKHDYSLIGLMSINPGVCQGNNTFTHQVPENLLPVINSLNIRLSLAPTTCLHSRMIPDFAHYSMLVLYGLISYELICSPIMPIILSLWTNMLLFMFMISLLFAIWSLIACYLKTGVYLKWTLWKKTESPLFTFKIEPTRHWRSWDGKWEEDEQAENEEPEADNTYGWNDAPGWCYARFTSPLYYLPYPGIELPTSLR